MSVVDTFSCHTVSEPDPVKPVPAVAAEQVLDGAPSSRSPYPLWAANAVQALESRYLNKKEGQIIEDPDGMLRRVAKCLASVEPEPIRNRMESVFFEHMRRFNIMPNSPTLMNAGRPLGMLSACFVLPIKDSLDEIMKTAADTAAIQKAGGGCGYCLDELRPSGSFIASSGGRTSGPLSFWRMQNEVTNSIQQGCIIGSSLIPTAEGPRAIRDLVGSQPWVYTYSKEKGRIAFEKAESVFMTKKGAEVWKLTTDKGLVLYATPDHLILCRDGVDRPLSGLRPGMRLMPLTRYVKQDRTWVSLQDGHDTRCLQSRLTYADVSGVELDTLNGHDVHHADRDRTNDAFSNLRLLSRSEHMREHGKAERVERVSQWSKNDPKFGQRNGMHRSRFFSTRSAADIAAYRESVSAGLSKSNPMRDADVVASHPLFNDVQCKRRAKRGKIIALAMRLRASGYSIESTGLWEVAITSLPNHFRYKVGTILELFESWDKFIVHVTRASTLGSDPTQNLLACCAAMINDGHELASDESWDMAIQQYPEFPPKQFSSKNVRSHFGGVSGLVDSLTAVNHVVVSAEFSHREDVYDMTVPGSNHFAVVASDAADATGIIIHNSFRRGANMMMADVAIPDILKFLYIKQNLSQMTAYNISVKVSDEFMDSLGSGAVHKVYSFHSDKWYVLPRQLLSVVSDAVARSINNPMDLRAVDNCYGVQDLVEYDPKGDTYSADDYLTCDDIWSIICSNAWQTGEPGLCFIDRIRETEPTPHIGRINASNPCGEAFLLPDEACNLASVNLSNFITYDISKWPEGSSIDWDGLENAVRTCVRMLDNVIDANKFPTPDIERMVRNNRKIGLGVMGLADALFKLGVAYNSIDGVEATSRLMAFVQKTALNYDEELAAERGPFPNWKGSRWDTEHHRRMRNAEVTSVAPTGTISIIANCSGGIEPLFSLVFTRNVLDGKKLYQSNEFFEQVAKARGFLSDELLEQISVHGSLAHVAGIPEDVRRVFVCAHDIKPDDHVQMQAVVQRNTSNAVSKTCNLPASASVDDVARAYKLAHRLGCKAITVYRDGSRANQPMQLSNNADEQAKRQGVEKSDPEKNYPDALDASFELLPPSAPELAPSIRVRQPTVFGHLHVTVVFDPVGHRALEVFAQCGSSGGVEQADVESICRLASLLLRANYPLTQLIDQLSRPTTSLDKKTSGLPTSLPQALAIAILRAYEQFSTWSVHLVEPEPEERAGNGDRTYPQPPGGGNGCATPVARPASKSDNGNGNGHYGDAVRRRVMSVDSPGYKIRCPSGNPRCNGVTVMNGRCVTCSCGESSCA